MKVYETVAMSLLNILHSPPVQEERVSGHYFEVRSVRQETLDSLRKAP